MEGSRAEELNVREESVLLVVSQYLGSQRAAADVQAAQSRVDLAQALYNQAADLQSALHSARHHRHFPTVRDFMQNIHDHLYQKMPLIPLWQLDMHLAIGPGLRVPELDALAVFASLPQWRLAP